MGARGTHGVENRPMKKNATPDIDAFASLPDIHSNTAEDEFCGDTVPCEDNDAFDTQLVDSENETQPMDFCEDTQILYLDGETQVMDDYELDEYMDTQLLDLSDHDTVCESDEHSAERSQLVHDPKEFVGRNSDQTSACEETETDPSHQDDRGARRDSLLSDDEVWSSGSLRAASLAAKKKVSENARGPSSTEFSGKSSNFQCSNNNGGIFHVDAVDLEHYTETDDEKGLSNVFKRKVARSLAKELFMEADCVDELECNDNPSSEITGLSKCPARETEMAGLSYVDSQEPGDLSQANALEFVDKFLRVNVLEPDMNVNTRNAAGKMASPGRITKGLQNLAQQANHRSSHRVATAFDWDDTHEDEGGGEFFTKNKQILFETNYDAHKFCGRPRNSRNNGLKGSQSIGKLTNQEEQQNNHGRIPGLCDSDSKLVKYRKAGQLEETNKEADDYPNQQLGLLSCNPELLASATNAEPKSMLDVGIDTQMAAEAMEALSFVSERVANNRIIGEEDNKDARRKKVAKSTLLKQRCIEKQPCLSWSRGAKIKRTNRVTNKLAEETKTSVAFRTRSQYTVEEFNIGLGKPKVKCRRLPVKNISSVNERESCDRLASADGKETTCSVDGILNKNGYLPLERHNPQDKANVSTAAAQETGQHLVNGVNEESDDFRRQRQGFDVVHCGIDKTKCATITTVKDNAKVGRSSCRGKSLHIDSNKVNESGEKRSLVRAFGTLEVVPQSITRRTRSKRSARCAEFSRDACQLSSEKHQSCSPAKGVGAHTEGKKSHVQVRKSSPVNITPLGLKTPESAVSSLCVGDGYPTTPVCKGKRSLKREFYRLTASEPKYISPSKDLRQRRDFSNAQVLFSQHLDDDIIKKQEKILSRLGVPVASSISEATHFVADMFVRTRNMLEAIACGKPVVTHLWLESCGQSNCFIDEKNYILRDAKKEKELGFSMPNSLARARHCPLLEGRRIFITPKVKPSKKIVSGLVKAVSGQVTEKLCRTLSNSDRPDNLLVLSCDEDFQECRSLLEKGIAVYSSELLLNGIITQRLDYERYRIFVNHVKRTRLWVKRNEDQSVPVTVTK